MAVLNLVAEEKSRNSNQHRECRRGMIDREWHYHIVTICFPAIMFGLIVLYLYFKDRYMKMK